MALPRTLSQGGPHVSQGVCPVSEKGAVGWGISYWTLVGLGAVSVRLGGRWHLQRRSGNPTCFAPSCAAHSALARALLAGCLRGCCGGVGVAGEGTR